MPVMLSVESIADLAEGEAAAVINAAIKAAVNDTEDRGDDEKSRKVTITLEFVKMGQSIGVTVDAATKIPAYRTKPTIGDIVVDGRSAGMRFSPNSRRVDQPTIPGTGRTDDD